MKTTIPAISLTLLLSGCYTLYTPPQSGPTATLTVVKREVRDLAAATYVNADDCSGRLVLSGPKDPETRTYQVAAGKLMALTLAVDLPKPHPGLFAYGCNSAIAFTPQAGERYRAHFLIRPQGCRIAILKGSGVELRPGEYHAREWIRPFSDSGAYCKPR